MPSPSPDRRRLLVPSPLFLKAAVAVTAVGAVAPFWSFAGALVLPMLLVLIGLTVAHAWARPKADQVTVERVTDAMDRVGRKGQYTLVVTNTGSSLLRVTLREALPHGLSGEFVPQTVLLDGGAQARFPVAFIGVDRGTHSLLPTGLRVSRRLSLLEVQSHEAAPADVVVVPGRPAGETAWLLTRAALLEEHGSQSSRIRGADWEFDAMREFVPGDEMRRVDWKASSRRNRPMVRQYRSERNAEVILALDCGRLMGSLIGGVQKLDLTMTPVLDLAAVALRRGERVGFMAFDSRPQVYLPPRAGLRQLSMMTEALGRLPAAEQPTSYLQAVSFLGRRQRKRSLVLVFTDFTDELSAEDLMVGLAALGRSHQLMFISVSDPHLESVFLDPSQETHALFQRAVAGQLLHERRRVLSSLEHRGVITLDAEPRQLSGPLIRRFLELRLGLKT